MSTRGFGPLIGVGLLALTLGGCGMHEAKQPALDGPSELGFSLTLTASPDIVVADGFSTVLIQAYARDQYGKAIQGRQVVFTISDANGRTADLGALRSRSGVTLGTSAVETTDANGLAQVVFETPARTDATANQTVNVKARPVGSNADNAVYRTVRIELRSAEPRLFAQNPDNKAPTCNFIVQAPDGFRAGRIILFQSTSSDPDGTIVRYEWFFGDGIQDDSPDVTHGWRSAGTYSVTHVVTDNEGSQQACATSITITE
jgi:PKD repeat protein